MVQIIVGEPLGVGSGTIGAEGFSADDARELAAMISEKYVVTVDKTATGCCIDGRNCTHTLGETAPEIGPSVAGGPSVTAYGAAELVGDYFDNTSAPTTGGRIEEINKTLISDGIALGAHVSDGAVENSFINPASGLAQTGCGASDEFKVIMQKPNDNKRFVQSTTEALLGTDFNASRMEFVAKEPLENRIKDYNSREVLDIVAAPKAGKNVEVLQGKHAEVFPVFNYIKNTTVDRDRLVEETGKQVFVIDMWYIDELAHAMAAGRPDAEEMYSKLRHAMTAFQVSTYLTLCDGTHRPVILKPEVIAAGTAR